VIEIKEPSMDEKQKFSETEESSVVSSSNEESYDKLDVVRRKHTHPAKTGTNRWSVTDVESSSGESHYTSFEKADSRPLSSDVENMLHYASSEYDTAQDISLVPGSTEYHTAASTITSHSISSRESMKSFDSESSGGNMASIEASEASETLVPSTMEECDEGLQSDLMPSQDIESDENDKYSSLGNQSDIMTKEEEIEHGLTLMKRSHEMTFAPELKPIQILGSVDLLDDSKLQFEEKLARSVEDLKYGSLEEVKFGSSLEEGSILSVSISSASNLETMVEIHPEQADQLMGSLVGSYDSAKIFTSFTDDTVTSTPPETDHGSKFDSLLSSSISQEQEQSEDASKIFSESGESEPVRKRGHKRTDSSVFPGGFVKVESKDSSDSFDEDPVPLELESSEPISSEKDETHGESSDSDYDRYESEYARSFKIPSASIKSKSKTKADILDRDDNEKKIYSPGHSIIETIVEDVHAETEQSIEVHVDKRPSMQDYEIPDIQVTDDIVPEKNLKESKTTDHTTTSQHVQYAQQVEYKMSEEEYQEMLEKKYKSKESNDFEFEQDQPPSPEGSDSFEMLEQPDISDEFVIVEEVAKEAHEFDQEGKSVNIQATAKYVRKHDEEAEKYIIKSAPASTDAAAYVSDDINFEFDDSPPQGEDQENGTQLRGNGYPLEGSKRWVEMNLSDPANLRYPYDMDRGGILEDIKEEDNEFEIGSSRISSFKDSFSSTPDYDLLARKLHCRDNDNISMSSLQEFESLERVISLENRKQAQSSQESLSNGSFPKIKHLTKNAHGDDISVSSLKEFEGLENACLEAHLIEIKAKEEAALLLSRSDDSNKSGSSDGFKNGSPKVVSTTTKTIITSSTVSKKAEIDRSALERNMVLEFQKIEQRAQAKHDENRKEKEENLMEVSTDSLEGKPVYDKSSPQHLSSDSLDNKSNVDLMTSSVDSIEMSKEGAAGKSSDLDSIDPNSPARKRSDSIDSIELQLAYSSKMDRDSIDDTINLEISSASFSSGSKQQQHQQQKTITKTLVGPGGTTITTTTTIYKQEMPSKDISCESLNRTEPELLLTSTESLETSSTATNATYQNETDSQMSGSITSCGSNTLIDTLDSNYPDFYSPTSPQTHQQFHTSSSTTTTTTTYHEHEMFDDENFSPITFSVRPKQNIVVDSDSYAGYQMSNLSSYHKSGRIHIL
jgi:hypothetical protein